jgi:Na+/glutamate symporter
MAMGTLQVAIAFATLGGIAGYWVGVTVTKYF